MPNETVTRFAPSPTGYLHLGHACSAFFNHDLARACEGRFLLRIEDIDQGRSRPEYEEAIYEDLKWLGLDWDGPALRQSEHFARYEEALAGLKARGLLYRCFRTRKELSAIASAPHGPEHGGPVTAPLPPDEEARLLEEGRAFSWRLDTREALRTLGRRSLAFREAGEDGETREKQAPLAGLEDIVLGRKDFPASYHLASVLDDALQGVTLVWRGEDLRDAIPIHRLLQELLGLSAPVYRHHALVTDEQGRRLAKRDRAATLRALREEGESPEGIRRRLGLRRA